MNDLIQEGAEISIYDPMVSHKRVLTDLQNLWKRNFLDDKVILEKKSQIKIFDGRNFTKNERIQNIGKPYSCD